MAIVNSYVEFPEGKIHMILGLYVCVYYGRNMVDIW